jgi:diguanylate cyclase (GGDEF)-like protein
METKDGRGLYFSISLAQARLKLAGVNAVLIFLALGVKGSKIDYLIAGIYLSLSAVSLFIPALRYLATGLGRFPLLGIDLLTTSYMIARTGGTASELYPFLFIPVLVAVLRCKYPVILIWSSLMAMVLIGSALVSKTLFLIPLTIKVLYLFLTGILGGYLVNETHLVTEKRLTRQNMDLQHLNRFSTEVAGSSDLGDIFSQILKVVHQIDSSWQVAIMMFDTVDVLKIFASSGWEEDWINHYHLFPLHRNSLTLAPVIVLKAPVLCSDIQKHAELVETFTGIPVRSLAAFPFFVDGEMVGVLTITNPNIKVMGKEEVQLLSDIAHQASTALQNLASLREETIKANTDGLTGLYNRRFFNEQIDNLVYEARREKTFLSLILIDVDEFKKYNDTYGHPAGDHLLKVVTSVIASAAGRRAIAARYGGEEIAVILKETGNQTALQIAEKIRSAVENIPEETLKRQVTISVGVGTLPDHAKDRAGLVEYADKSLYQAKQTGKNRVCCGYKSKVI